MELSMCKGQRTEGDVWRQPIVFRLFIHVARAKMSDFVGIDAGFVGINVGFVVIDAVLVRN